MSQQQRICPACNTLLVPEAIYCPKCGTKYEQYPLSQTPATQQPECRIPEKTATGEELSAKPKSNSTAFFVMIAVLLFALLLMWAMDYNSEESRYKRACTALEKLEYTEAISLFEGLGGYLDSEDKLIQAKYGYVKANLNRYDSKTFTYLTELKDRSYINAKALYHDLYAWKLEVVAVNSDPGDTTTNKTSISRNSPLYVHLLLEGGTPGETTTLRVDYTLPNGETDSYTFNSAWGDNNPGWYGWEEGLGGSTGTLYLRFYDGKGALLTSHAVYISN